MNQKTCAKCGESKDKSFFKPNTKLKDGLASWCIPCFKEYRKSHRPNKPHLKALKEGYKVCRKCTQEKEFSEFTPNKNSKTGLSSWCKICTSSYQKERKQLIHSTRAPEDGLKECTKCGQRKPASTEFFNKMCKGKNGLNPVCKICHRELQNSYAKKDRKEYYKKRYEENKEVVLAQTRIRNATYTKTEEYRVWVSNYLRNRKQNDPGFRAMDQARKRVRQFLKGKEKYSKKLGCSYAVFKSHVESQFQPGMTWDNYGEWELDHKIPLALAYLQGPEAFKSACLYTNLCPMWAKDHDEKTKNDIKTINELKNMI